MAGRIPKLGGSSLTFRVKGLHVHSGRLTTAAGRCVSTCLHPLSDPPVLSGFHAPPTRPAPLRPRKFVGLGWTGEERVSSRQKRPQQLLCSVGVSPVLHCRLAVERPRRQVSCDGARPYGKAPPERLGWRVCGANGELSLWSERLPLSWGNGCGLQWDEDGRKRGGSGTACGSKLSRGRHYNRWCKKPESRGALPRVLDVENWEECSGQRAGQRS